MKSKIMLLLCLLVLALAGAAHAQASKADRDAMLAHLQKSQKALDAATKGLSPAQWNFKPAPDRWSIAEVYEHITLAEDFLRDLIEQGVAAPAAPEKKAGDNAAKDAQVEKVVTDRSQKFQAPDPLKPTGRWSVDQMKKEFAARRAKTRDFATHPADDLRTHFFAGPAGELDAVQWVLFLSGHTERHTAQILEVEADPNFPKQ